ncbi:hypothetical protein [Sinorhizobium terangae]|uniref:Uncharacterized protein n=1 Tax=Sinorhizobium terangae TaxID=110322 RepID=A0A6N7LAX0_SINTE|nr:hypothetical protein [Sinorhizobium terangae]MBB4187029.1 hypothetical protein [Sinorhizobium terangae]MQX14339.1 hypothetical protein [Sinorhizobium terangae]WFU49945.1 hypothetical protein QA637_24355 [Sinorhizobium terangae]
MSTGIAKYAGLLLACGAWAINTQLGQILPYADCGAGVSWSTVASFVAVAVALAGTLVSHARFGPSEPRAILFIAKLNVLAGLAFAFALLLQAAAAMLLDPCLR